jgi:hypothetical protein
MVLTACLRQARGDRCRDLEKKGSQNTAYAQSLKKLLAATTAQQEPGPGPGPCMVCISGRLQCSLVPWVI